MKNKGLLALAFALAIGVPFAHAQIVTETFLIHGSNNPTLVTSATATVNSITNTYTLFVDNTINGIGGVHGTITSLGFDTPFTDTQLGTNGSNVSLSIQWTQINAGHSVPSAWSILEPYDLNAGGNQFGQDLGGGVHAGQPNGGNPNLGIEFGEKATLVFTLPDFSTSDISGFFNDLADLTFRWQDVVNAQQSSDANDGFGTPVGQPGDPSPVPEPSTYGMMAASLLLGIAGWNRFSKRASHQVNTSSV